MAGCNTCWLAYPSVYRDLYRRVTTGYANAGITHITHIILLLLIYYVDASYISKTSLTFCYCPGAVFRPSGVCAFIPFSLWSMGLSTQLFCLPLLFHWPLKGRSIVFSLPPERSEAPLVMFNEEAAIAVNPRAVARVPEGGHEAAADVGRLRRGAPPQSLVPPSM